MCTSPFPVHLCSTEREINNAAHALAQARGSFALDVERASGFCYDDRAYLIQIKRTNSDIFLIDPIDHPDAVRTYLAPVLNSDTWLLHAASNDLPSLAELGLTPAQLFDTEIASRLLNFSYVNLSYMVEELCGVHLKKGKGAENWSQRPLPKGMIDYAALDVAYLDKLAQALDEKLQQENKRHWLEQECGHIVKKYARIIHRQRSWENTKGIHELRTPKELTILRELWIARENKARQENKAPNRLLTDKALIHLAQRPAFQLSQIRPHGKPIAISLAKIWLNAIKKAHTIPPAQRPKSVTYNNDIPPRNQWARYYTESHLSYNHIKESLIPVAESHSLPLDNLIEAKALREIVWKCTQTSEIVTIEDLDHAFTHAQVRAWQKELTFDVIADEFFD
ncbi:Ribonuclease D [Corynebacterium kutscheri]|uniref:Ribonuclease D n=1 Tax=Corynebacterium kutscheri TaxID=35755 RepID=A0A0F6R0M7_9CORY|nr:HRDC domain-containing protein [Corynebacterium kutscheri]AKE41365.1 ribonuclease D [Corynebacterium kutscheri]VEH08641.1 Ribonuclease D [Corynebacterium kutscheri]VEH09687.1 Ribonuclease D [Corynebacterium kutscheri]VEH79770.1 Ribonuclease D [Corynebacterium kutscheri]